MASRELAGQLKTQKSRFSFAEFMNENLAPAGDNNKIEKQSSIDNDANSNQNSSPNDKPTKSPIIPFHRMSSQGVIGAEEDSTSTPGSENRTFVRRAVRQKTLSLPGSEANSPTRSIGNSNLSFKQNPKRRLHVESKEPLITEEFFPENSHMRWDQSKGSKLIWILKKDLKTNEEADYIYQNIQNYSFFSQFVAQNLGDLEDNAILQLCKHMKYESIAAGDYVFREGDPSNDKLYIILSGTVSLILKNDRNVFVQENLSEAEDAENEDQSPAKSKHRSTSKDNTPLFKKGNRLATINLENTRTRSFTSALQKSADKSIGSDGENTPVKRQKSISKADRLKRGLSVKTDSPGTPTAPHKQMSEGEAFGEKALTSKDSKRTASIFAKTDCQFIILMKEDYLSIVGRYNKEHRLKLEFIKQNIPYIDRINSNHILEDLLYMFSVEIFKRGSKIVEEDKPGKRVYLLASGECMVEKNVLNEKTDNSKKLFLAKISPPALIGDEVLFEGKGKRKSYKYTVKVDSIEAKVYHCELSALRLRFPKESLFVLRNNYIEKEKIRNKRINFVQQVESNGKNNREVPELKALIQFATKGSRANLIFKPYSDLARNMTELKDSEVGQMKSCFDIYSRNYASIKKELSKRDLVLGESEKLGGGVASEQQEQGIYSLFGQTERGGYDYPTSRMDLKTSGLNSARERFEPEPLFNQKTQLTEVATPLQRFKKSMEEKLSIKLMELSSDSDPNEEEEDKETKKMEKKHHRRTQSYQEQSIDKREPILGPRPFRPKKILTKRHFIIRKSMSEVEFEFRSPKELELAVTDPAPTDRQLFARHNTLAELKTEETPNSERANSLKTRVETKHEQVPDLTKKDPSFKLPFVSNLLTNLYNDKKAQFIRRGLGTVSNHMIFLDVNDTKNRSKAPLTLNTERQMPSSNIVAAKPNKASLETISLLKSSQHDSENGFKPLRPQNLPLTKDSSTQSIDPLKKRTSSCSPSVATIGKLDILQIQASPNITPVQELTDRSSRKSITIKNLKQRSLQMKALQSGRMADPLKQYD